MKLFTLSVLTFLHISYVSVDGIVIKGQLQTSSDFVFLGRFCFESNGKGSLQYRFKYLSEDCCYNLLLFNDEPGQWSRIRNHEKKMSCVDKKELLPDNNSVKVPLGDSNIGCVRNNETLYDTLIEYVICYKSYTFRTSRERWWYFVISNCNSIDGIYAEYELIMTNGDTFWKKHFSADESHILQTNLTFLVLYSIVLCLVNNMTRILIAKKLLHTTYKLFVCSLCAEFMAVIGLFSCYVIYARDGVENHTLKFCANLSSALGVLLFVLMLILVGKGYTVTRGILSRKSYITISVFMTLYSLTYLTLYIYEITMFDPRDVLYKYQSPAGYGLVALHFIGALWMYYCIGFTIKHNQDKINFYMWFALIYSTWWLATPATIFICNFALQASMRAKVVNAMERCVIFLGHIFFLFLTRPSAANQNFPFHIKTTQIGIMEDNELETYAGTGTGDNYVVENNNNFDNMFDNSLNIPENPSPVEAWADD